MDEESGNMLGLETPQPDTLSMAPKQRYY